MTTLEEAQDWLREHIDEGAECPCCHQFAKVYRRKITSGAAHGLIRMYLHSRLDWIHVPSVPDLSRNGGEIARLRYWGLIEEAVEKREDGGRAGWWRVTERGERYVRAEQQVPTYVRLYDGEVQGFLGKFVGIREALGTKFNYADLMAGV